MKIRGALVWIILGTGLACCTSPAMAQNLRPELSDLHREIFNWRRLHRLQFHLDAPMQSDGLGPRGGNALTIHISHGVCSQRGADVRPDFNWNKTSTAMMGYRVK